MAKTGKSFEGFVKTVKKLREKCPWDRQQTFESLKPYLVEEVYEALQAIDDKDFDKLSEELGDMLLHVVMLSNMAAEKKRFSIREVISGIEQKMIRRHPHVFGDIKAKNADEVLARWERITQNETKQKAAKHQGIFKSIPRTLPALYRAQKVQRRAARLGFDWDKVAGAWGKVYEEIEELKLESRAKKVERRRVREEVGDLLFAIVNVARKLDIDAEDAMQQASSKFMRRFEKIEKKLHKKKMTLKQMDDLWNKVKASET
ncbi:MAG: nucleoside triphosphate pyrophosphohydrolase [Candidatus Margulisbacteria bacterium]|nr:nucleoside triphosphate pyrophosphohydrolase [Candidatus Margulisiibacteriota bacterium]